MWILFAFLSAFFLGCYDINKKISVNNNAVIPVLFLNTLFCTLFILPIYIHKSSVIRGEDHIYILIKAVLVLSSWLFGYFATKHLPLTLTGLVNASRPMLTLLGAMLIYGESLNTLQSLGVIFTVVAIILLSINSQKHEGVTLKSNRWIAFIFLAAVTGCLSGLYDKFLMQKFPASAVQFWYNFYQFILMFLVLLILWLPRRKHNTSFKWKWHIIFISLFLTVADYFYFIALSKPDAMISITSMIRRGSVIISFIGGIVFFKEQNIWRKASYLFLILVGMLLLYLGTQ